MRTNREVYQVESLHVVAKQSMRQPEATSLTALPWRPRMPMRDLDGWLPGGVFAVSGSGGLEHHHHHHPHHSHDQQLFCFMSSIGFSFDAWYTTITTILVQKKFEDVHRFRGPFVAFKTARVSLEVLLGSARPSWSTSSPRTTALSWSQQPREPRRTVRSPSV